MLLQTTGGKTHAYGVHQHYGLEIQYWLASATTLLPRISVLGLHAVSHSSDT